MTVSNSLSAKQRLFRIRSVMKNREEEEEEEEEEKREEEEESVDASKCRREAKADREDKLEGPRRRWEEVAEEEDKERFVDCLSYTDSERLEKSFSE